MSAEYQSIDDQIKVSFQSASQVETQARQLEARIVKIDGAKRHLPARRYGHPVDLNKIRSNLTLTSLIAQDSAELSHYCGIDPILRHRVDDELEAQAMRSSSLRIQTEALRQQNAQAQSDRDRAFHAGLNPATHRRQGTDAFSTTSLLGLASRHAQ